MENKVYDMIVIGGGPGGYTAALYAARAGMTVAVAEKLGAGGQMAQTHLIDNYPGFEEGVDGFELAQRMRAQAERFGAETLYTQVEQVDLKAQPKVLRTAGGELRARTVALSMGAGPRPLGVPGESGLVGRGVAYCAACDGMFYRGKTVAVVGGGNSAAADALLLSRIAKKVILIHRRDRLRATKIYHHPLQQAENIELRLNARVTGLHSEGKLTGITVEDIPSGKKERLEVDGLFVSVGRLPATELVKDQLSLDSSGYIPADETARTELPGVYAVGDLRAKPLRQIVTAAADGAVAAHMAEEYLASLKTQ